MLHGEITRKIRVAVEEDATIRTRDAQKLVKTFSISTPRYYTPRALENTDWLQSAAPATKTVLHAPDCDKMWILAVKYTPDLATRAEF